MSLPLDRHWKNVGWALGVEAFWGLSLALISVVAIVPVFLSHLGASNTVLGALPAIWTLMAFLPGAFGSHFTSHLPLRKQAVFIFHALSGIPWVFMAAWFGLGGRHSSALDIGIFLLLWGGSWGFMGLFIPVWINFIGKVTRPELRATSFGVIFFFQTLMGILGGWIANRILASPLPFPQNYALGFFVAGLCMTAGSFFFLPVVEDPGATAPQGQAVRTVIAHMREVLTDKGGVRVYLAMAVLTVGGWLLISYYPVFAEKRFGLLPRDSAIFTAVCMAGQMIGSLVTGIVGDRYGYAKVATVSVVALTIGLVIAIWGNQPALYYVTAFLTGLYIVTDRLAQFNLSMAFCPHEDNTAWLGAIPAITAPIVAVVAGSAGTFIDRFGFPNVGIVGLCLALGAAYLAFFRLKEPAYSLAGRRNAT
ncbi:MAG TPA: MFS transporter [Methylomirabilota bacterium]|nr:MFS transporter [Methylomirabilota bacterium]